MVPKIRFNPSKDIPSLSEKVIIVTGGNNGLGKETLLQLAKHNPHTLYMGARSESKATAAIADIQALVPNAKIKFLPIDISSFASVKLAAETFLAENKRLDILINNAGVMGVAPGLTEDGYEVVFGTNHMGPALFTKLLLPLLLKTAALPNADVRIVNLSSEAIRFAPKEGLTLSQNKTPLSHLSSSARYGLSKLAPLYHSRSLAKLYPTIKSVAVHPGLVRTGILDNYIRDYPYLSWVITGVVRLFTVDVEEGAVPQLFAACGEREDVRSGGFYYPGVVEFAGTKLTEDAEMADELWRWTEKELESKGF